jgi:uncharacterized coiled-coil protein SlyX
LQASQELQQRLSQQEATASQLQVELAELKKTRAQAQQQLAAAEEKVGWAAAAPACAHTLLGLQLVLCWLPCPDP